MLRFLVPICVLGLFMATPRLASGTCDPTLISDAVVAHIDQESLDAVLKPVGALVPEQLDLSDFNASIDCGSFFQATTIQTHRGQIKLAIENISIALGSNTLTIDITGDIEAGANLDMSVCSLPKDNCDAALSAKGVSIHAVVGVGVTQCVPTVSVTEFQLFVDERNVGISLDNCGGYGLAFSIIEDWLRRQMLDYAKTELGDYVPTIIQDQVSALTTDLLSEALTFEKVSFKAQPEIVQVDSTGLTIGFAALAQADTIAECARGVAVPPLATSVPSIVLPANTSVGVSQRIAQNLVTAAWQAGWMCLDLSSVVPEISTVFQSVLPGAKTAVTVNVMQSPTVVFDNSKVGGAKLALPAIAGSVSIDVPNERDYSASFSTGFSLGANVSIKRENNQIVLSPREVQVAPVDVTLGDANIGITEEGLQRFIRGSVAPLFTTRLQELPMVSALFDASLVAVIVESLHTTSSAIIAEIGIAGIVGNDNVPPATKVMGQIPQTSGPSLELTVASTDDTTDASMVRHLIEVDGKRQRSITTGGTVVIGPMTAGRHSVRIAAVDLVGNTDPEGSKFELMVDATPPTVYFDGSPVGIIPANGTKLYVKANDDMGVTGSYDYTVGIVSRIAEPDEVFIRATQDFGQPIVLMNLPDAVTLRVTATARDMAGNATTVSQSFAVLDQPTMGCSSVTAEWPALVVAFLIFARSRRRNSCSS